MTTDWQPDPWAGDVGDLYIMEEIPAPPLTRSSRIGVTCRCPNQPERPCGNLVTQEDLLCNACRDVKNGTGNCAAVSSPCCGTFHFTLVLGRPLADYVHVPPEGA